MEHHSIELYDRLHHLIEYVKNHPDSQKPDLMLGFYLCEGNGQTIQMTFSDQWSELNVLFFLSLPYVHSSTEDNASE